MPTEIRRCLFLKVSLLLIRQTRPSLAPTNSTSTPPPVPYGLVSRTGPIFHNTPHSLATKFFQTAVLWSRAGRA